MKRICCLEAKKVWEGTLCGCGYQVKWCPTHRTIWCIRTEANLDEHIRHLIWCAATYPHIPYHATGPARFCDEVEILYDITRGGRRELGAKGEHVPPYIETGELIAKLRGILMGVGDV